VELDDGELAARAAGWTSPPLAHPGRVYAKYAATVGSASDGAITGIDPRGSAWPPSS
jgi:hypothetical protein